MKLIKRKGLVIVNQLSTGKYVVTKNGKVVCKTFSLDEAEGYVED